MISKILSPVTFDNTNPRITRVDFLLVLLCLSLGCSEVPPNQTSSTDPTPVNPESVTFDPRYEIPGDSLALQPDKRTSRKAYFGDLHVHTSHSLDAFAHGTLATPGDASVRILPAKAMMEHERLDELKGATYPTPIEHRNRSKQAWLKIPVEL